MLAVAARHHQQRTTLVHDRHHGLLRRRIEDNFCEHEPVLRLVADKIDAGCVPQGAPSAICSDRVACSEAEGCPAVPAPEENAIRTRLGGFDQMAAPNLHTEFQRPLGKKPLGRFLR